MSKFISLTCGGLRSGTAGLADLERWRTVGAAVDAKLVFWV
jgi:hypothetical protein